MDGHLTMSAKELRRKTVFDEVKAGRLTKREAARRLGICYRQVLRSYERFVAEGDAGLVHRSRGKPSNRGAPPSVKRKALKRYRKRYAEHDLGPTLAAEKLRAEGVVVDHETLRRWLLEAGLWNKRRKRKVHRSRRERKEGFGQLVQMDGSPHRWFGSEYAPACLMNMVDDAAGTTLGLMDEQETTVAAMTLLRRWIERYGIPQALYTDKKTVFVTDREPTVEEQLAGEKPMTAFGKACAKLGIEIIPAQSPQAKGRVERSHGVYQDRLVKELALRGVTTIAGANKVLEGGFVDDLNAKFARAPRSDVDFHRPLPKGLDLAHVLCFEQTRVVQNDWCVRFENRHYQILADNRPLPKPKDKVIVRTLLDGSRHILFRDKALRWRLLPKAEVRQRYDKAPALSTAPKPATPRSRPKPSRSPWRQGVSLMFADTEKKDKPK